jgi:hypothetical protein
MNSPRSVVVIVEREKRARSPRRAISIRQPYAEQIMRGLKTKEYRTKPTNIRERVYVYASLRPGDRSDFELLGVEPEDLRTGVLIGSIEIVGCEWDRRSDQYAYRLANPVRLKRHLRPKKQPQPVWFYPF